MTQTIVEPHAMQAWADAERAAGRRIALVPTMGALHAGHLKLVAEARRRADRVVVSIFVNPIQFDRRDDFDRYPRPLDADLAACATAGVDVVFAPTAVAMYPAGFETSVTVAHLTDPLCGRVRPGHFAGVTTVVSKLFHCVRPHYAVFGEKDWQQLAVVRRMTADLDFGIEIVGVSTVREADGLALSSRNQRLSPPERDAARCVPRALEAAAVAVAAGETRSAAIVAAAEHEIADEPQARLEYAELRDPATLDEVAEVAAPTLLALAVWVGTVRLIDNRILTPARNAREGDPNTGEAARESARAGRWGLGASEQRSARSARAADGPPKENSEAAPERARAGRRGSGASEQRSARSARAADGPPKSTGVL